MAITRQDAWTDDEDKLLANTVIQFILEGGTQLSAFEVVGKKLSRTSAACGFRWNSAVRKNYINDIAAAKKKKKLAGKNKVKVIPEVSSNENVVKDNRDVDRESNTLQIFSRVKEDIGVLEAIFLNKGKEDKSFQQLKLENEQLKNKVMVLQQEITLIEEDYKAFMTLMDRARKLTKNEMKNKIVRS
ncbi:MAG: gerR [Bacillales bacterium]|jgi:RsfA family transcription factor|nr:gerR [Bacillales bacterium]